MSLFPQALGLAIEVVGALSLHMLSLMLSIFPRNQCFIPFGAEAKSVTTGFRFFNLLDFEKAQDVVNKQKKPLKKMKNFCTHANNDM